MANECQVAASKQGMETALQSGIEDMKASLEEMAIYRRVYPDLSLGALIANVFKGITDFSRSAIKYYKNHGMCKSSLLSCTGQMGSC